MTGLITTITSHSSSDESGAGNSSWINGGQSGRSAISKWIEKRQRRASEQVCKSRTSKGVPGRGLLGVTRSVEDRMPCWLLC